MATIQETLNELQKTGGFMGAALVDADSGMSAGTIGGNAGFNIDVAAAVNCDVYKAKMRATKELNQKDAIEDILITLETQYHLICPVPHQMSLFYYLALTRDQANLAMARIKLKQIAGSIQI